MTVKGESPGLICSKSNSPGWDNRAAMKAPTGAWGEIVNGGSLAALVATVVTLIGLG